MIEQAKPAKPYRNFGVIRHHFPEMTEWETFFIWAFVGCGIVCIAVGDHAMRDDSWQFKVVACCMLVMTSVIGYWMRNEPAACLAFILFPFTGWQIRWPRLVLRAVQAFGVLGLLGAACAAAVGLLPRSWSNDHPLFVVLAFCSGLAITYKVLWKPRARRSAAPAELLQP